MVLLQRTREWEFESLHPVEESQFSRTRNGVSFDEEPATFAEPENEPVSRSERFGRWIADYGTPPWFVLGDAFAVALTLAAFDQALAGVVVTAIGVLALNGGRGLYRPRLTPSAVDDVPALVGGLLVVASLVYMLSGNGTATIGLLGDGYGRGWWTATAAAALGMIVTRALGYRLLRLVRKSKLISHRTLIVGAGVVGAQVADTLAEFPEYGLTPVAFHDPEPLWGVDRTLPVLRSTSLGQSIQRTRATIVVVCYSSLADSQLVEYLLRYHREEAEFFFVPRLFELDAGRASDVDRLRSLPLRRLRRAAHRTFSWKVKLVLDRLAAAAMLIVLSPVLLGIALAIRTTMGSPIIFRQERVGIDGRPFEILKFRSLPNATDQQANTEWAAESNRKPSRLGAFLRASSLDELPQLLNILRGDMSFVGPRPERPHFVGEFANTHRRYNFRHRVPSGLTGLSQVSGLRGDTSIEERVRFDNTYVESWSLTGDLRILLRTLREVLPGSKS